MPGKNLMAWKQLEMELRGTTGKQVGNTAAAGCLAVQARFQSPPASHIPGSLPAPPLSLPASTPLGTWHLSSSSSLPLESCSLSAGPEPAFLSLIAPLLFSTGGPGNPFSYFFHSSGPLAPQNEGHLDTPNLPSLAPPYLLVPTQYLEPPHLPSSSHGPGILLLSPLMWHEGQREAGGGQIPHLWNIPHGSQPFSTPLGTSSP